MVGRRVWSLGGVVAAFGIVACGGGKSGAGSSPTPDAGGDSSSTLDSGGGPQDAAGDSRTDANADGSTDAGGPTPTLVIGIDTTKTTPLAPGFSGANNEPLLNAVQSNDAAFEALVQQLHLGWLRFPAGIPSIAYDWQTGLISPSFMGALSGESPALLKIVANAVPLTAGKGGVRIADHATLAQATGASTIVDVNAVTDSPTSAGALASWAKSHALPVAEWEMTNEPYSLYAHFPNATAYANTEQPYGAAIKVADSSAVVGLFYAGLYSGFGSLEDGGAAGWDDALAAYPNPWWDAITTHFYPVNVGTTLSLTDLQKLGNGVLAHGTTDYVTSYLVPKAKAGTPIFFSEAHVTPEPGDANEQTLYAAIFCAELVTRLSTLPMVKRVGIHTLYLGNSSYWGLVRAVSDHDRDVIDAYEAGAPIDTTTLSFGFFLSATGLAMQIVNGAVNASSATYATTVTGGGTVPISGFDGMPVPSVYAQAYEGQGGRHYLLVTNKSAVQEVALVRSGGKAVAGPFTVTSVSDPDPSSANTYMDKTKLTAVTASSGNPVVIPAYGVVGIAW